MKNCQTERERGSARPQRWNITLLETGKFSPLTDCTSGIISSLKTQEHSGSSFPSGPHSFQSTNRSQNKTIPKTSLFFPKALAPAADKTQAQPNSITPILCQSHRLQHQFQCPVAAECTEKVEFVWWFGVSLASPEPESLCQS